MDAFTETTKAFARIRSQTGLRSSTNSRNSPSGSRQRRNNTKINTEREERNKLVPRQRDWNVPEFDGSTVHSGIRSAIRQSNSKVSTRRPRETNKLARREVGYRKQTNRGDKRNKQLPIKLKGYAMDNDCNNIRLHSKHKFGSLLNELTHKRPTGDVTINRRDEFSTPMPMVSPSASARNFGEEMGMVVRGSEFLTTIDIFTTLSTSPSPTGIADTLFSLPLCPLFMPGTRLLKFSEMYRKFKFTNVVLEFIPNAPSTQNGGFIGWVNHDPGENLSTATSSDAKIREAMARKGAEIWNCMTYGRVHYHDDGSLGWYVTGDANEVQLSCPGTMNIISDSTFLAFDGVQTSLTVGQLILHYELHLCDRIFDENDDTDAGNVLWNLVPTVSTDTFGPAATVDEAVYITQAAWTGATGIAPLLHHIFIIRVLSAMLTGPTTTPANIPTCNTNNGGHQLLSRGSIWYGFVPVDGSGDRNVYITNNLGDALDRTISCTYNQSLLTYSSFAITISTYVTDYDD